MAVKGGKKPGAGRPKGVPNKATGEIKKIAQQYGLKAIKRLAKIIEDDNADVRAQIAAAKELLDRGYGKSPQALTDSEGGKLFPTKIEVILVKSKN